MLITKISAFSPMYKAQNFKGFDKTPKNTADEIRALQTQLDEIDKQIVNLESINEDHGRGYTDLLKKYSELTEKMKKLNPNYSK